MTLEQYLKSINKKPGTFQRENGIPHPSVYRWINGVIPEKEWISKIKKITKGKVTADSFYGE